MRAPQPSILSMQKPAALFALAAFALAAVFPGAARAASPEEINVSVTNGLRALLRSNPTARALASQAVAVLVFPKIVKGGFLIAGQFGEGALLENDAISGYYSTAAASLGYQAGIEQYGYALFFMNQQALDYLHKSKGWSLGAGPSLTIVDKGFAKNFSTSTFSSDVYACVFDQKGLMGGIGVQGQKITRIHPH